MRNAHTQSMVSARNLLQIYKSSDRRTLLYYPVKWANGKNLQGRTRIIVYLFTKDKYNCKEELLSMIARNARIYLFVAVRMKVTVHRNTEHFR